jgi:hypothetical protein
LVSQVVTERNVSLLFSSELDKCHFDAWLPVEENLMLYIFDKGMFYGQTFPKSFPLDRGTA